MTRMETISTMSAIEELESARVNYFVELTPRIDIYAGTLAHIFHRGQTRRDGLTPYVEHLRRVANDVAGQGWGADVVAAAWLHDCVEDGHVTLEELLALGMPFVVVNAVATLTKPAGVVYADYIASLLDKPAYVRAIKVADIRDNLADDPKPSVIPRYEKALKVLCS